MKSSEGPHILIIGSGPAGLGAASAAQSQGLSYEILEGGELPFGHCKSFELGGIVFDEGPHISFTKHQAIKDLFAASAGDVISLKPAMSNFWRGHWIPHPVQTNLRDVPMPLRRQIVESMQARPSTQDRISNYHEWLVASFGERFTEEFPVLYTEKYWTVHPSLLSTDWIGERISQPPLQAMIASASDELPSDLPSASPGALPKKDDHYFSEFRYPRQGGYQSFLRASLERHRDKLHLSARIVAIDPVKRFATTDDGRRFHYDVLLTSQALDDLVTTVGERPSAISLARERLRCSAVTLYSFVFKARKKFQTHWIYVYDRDLPFARIHFPLVLQGRADEPIQALQAEVYSSAYSPAPAGFDDLDLIIRSLERMELLRAGDIIKHERRHCAHGNVIFDHERSSAVRGILDFLESRRIFPVGRYGKWAYLWSDESYLDGEATLERALQLNDFR